METREEVIKQGEAELTNHEVCPICRGHGSYMCVHCLVTSEEGNLAWFKDDCHACGGDEYSHEHKCPACKGAGRRRPPEVLYAEESGMRDINLEGYRLQLWDCGTQYGSGPQFQVYYRLTAPNGDVLFEGNDYGASPIDAIDSDNTVRGIISFLTLRPGDTDADYFSNYTQAQWDFAHGDAEQLSIWSCEPEHYPECEKDHLNFWKCADGCPMREYDPDLSIFPEWGDQTVQE